MYERMSQWWQLLRGGGLVDELDRDESRFLAPQRDVVVHQSIVDRILEWSCLYHLHHLSLHKAHL